MVYLTNSEQILKLLKELGEEIKLLSQDVKEIKTKIMEHDYEIVCNCDCEDIRNFHKWEE